MIMSTKVLKYTESFFFNDVLFEINGMVKIFFFFCVSRCRLMQASKMFYSSLLPTGKYSELKIAIY